MEVTEQWKISRYLLLTSMLQKEYYPLNLNWQVMQRSFGLDISNFNVEQTLAAIKGATIQPLR
jgi:hypothetical protein